MGAVAFGEIVGESRLPGAHFDAVKVQARSRQDGILWPFGGANVLVAGCGFHGSCETSLANDFLREFEPGAITCIGAMHDAFGVRAAKSDNCIGEIESVSRAAALGVDDFDFFAGCG